MRPFSLRFTIIKIFAYLSRYYFKRLKKNLFFCLKTEPKEKVQRETKEGRVWGRRKRRFG